MGQPNPWTTLRDVQRRPRSQGWATPWTYFLHLSLSSSSYLTASSFAAQKQKRTELKCGILLLRTNRELTDLVLLQQINTKRSRDSVVVTLFGISRVGLMLILCLKLTAL